MDIALLIANILCLAAFGLHTFMCDREFKLFEPQGLGTPREKWTQARSGWHMVSVDLLSIIRTQVLLPQDCVLLVTLVL